MSNVVEIQSTSTMKKMTEAVSQDNGNGGTAPNNNREYSGFVFNGNLIPNNPGPVGDPSRPRPAESRSEFFNITYHSHPSGTKRVTLPGGGRGTATWSQPPSRTDMVNNKGTTEYVFAMAQQKIYIFNNTGVTAIIPKSVFQ